MTRVIEICSSCPILDQPSDLISDSFGMGYVTRGKQRIGHSVAGGKVTIQIIREMQE